MNNRFYPCDGENGYCPFDATYSNHCEQYCGLGRDEDEYPYDEYMEEDCE